MDKEELHLILTKLSRGFIENKIDGNLFAFVVEGLITTNLNLVPLLEELSDALAQYHEPNDTKGLVKKKRIIGLLKKHFDV